MGSWSESVNKDQRIVVDGAEQVTAPESQIANPLGVSIQRTHSSGATNVDYGGITIQEFPPQVGDMIEAVLESNQKALEQMAAFSQEADSTSESLVDTIEAIKTPLAKYMPYVIVLAGLFVLVKLKR